MDKKLDKRLTMNRETLRTLDSRTLTIVVGGGAVGSTGPSSANMVYSCACDGVPPPTY